MERDLTSGSVWKTIASFSLPYILSYFLQTLYGMADLYIVGRFYGAGSITAVSVGSQVMHMITVMIVGLAMGSTIATGQAAGAKQEREASETVGNTVTLFLTLSVAAAGALLVLVKPVVEAMSVPAGAVSGTTAYLVISFAGIPFITAYNVVSSVFRGLGDSKSPMYFIAAACAANIILDYVFIGGLHLGAAGAAFGTVLSQLFSVLVSFFCNPQEKDGAFFEKRRFQAEAGRFKKDFKNRNPGGFAGRPDPGRFSGHYRHCEPQGNP